MQQTIGQGVKPFIEIPTHPLNNSCQISFNKQSDKELSQLLKLLVRLFVILYLTAIIKRMLLESQ
jgi:hypothetical protein